MNKLVFLLDVDNTLLDNDDVKADLDKHIQVEMGPELAGRFWEIYEQVRHERDVVDIPLSLIRLREQTSLTELDQITYDHVQSLFNNYPFYRALYPDVLETLEYLRSLGLTVVVSDGDLCFQAEKIVNSYLALAVEGRVLLYIHKQDHIDEITKQYPAEHYAMIDDKPKILVDSKKQMGERLTTVFVQQGKYAKQIPEDFNPDITVAHIGDLRNYGLEQFLSFQQK